MAYIAIPVAGSNDDNPLTVLFYYLFVNFTFLLFFETYVDFAKKDVSENTNSRQRRYAAIESFSFEQPNLPGTTKNLSPNSAIPTEKTQKHFKEKEYSLKSTLKKTR